MARYKQKAWLTHQSTQDDFEGQEVTGGVQHDAPVCKSGKVADCCCIDAFLKKTQVKT